MFSLSKLINATLKALSTPYTTAIINEAGSVSITTTDFSHLDYTSIATIPEAILHPMKVLKLAQQMSPTLLSIKHNVPGDAVVAECDTRIPDAINGNDLALYLEILVEFFSNRIFPNFELSERRLIQITYDTDRERFDLVINVTKGKNECEYFRIYDKISYILNGDFGFHLYDQDESQYRTLEFTFRGEQFKSIDLKGDGMFKLPTLEEVRGATKYCYVASGGFYGVTLLLNDGRVFTTWDDGSIEWNNSNPDDTDGIDLAIETFIEYGGANIT